MRRVLATINCTQKREIKRIVWLGALERKEQSQSKLSRGRTQAETGNGEGED